MAIPHLANSPDGCGVLNKFFKVSWSAENSPDVQRGKDGNALMPTQYPGPPVLLFSHVIEDSYWHKPYRLYSTVLLMLSQTCSQTTSRVRSLQYTSIKGFTMLRQVLKSAIASTHQNHADEKGSYEGPSFLVRACRDLATFENLGINHW